MRCPTCQTPAESERALARTRAAAALPLSLRRLICSTCGRAYWTAGAAHEAMRPASVTAPRRAPPRRRRG